PAHFQAFGPSFDLFKRVDNSFLAMSFPWHFLSFLGEPPTIRKLKFLPSSFRIQGKFLSVLVFVYLPPCGVDP
ncbi:MAG: hypothetical protein WBW78_12015, partial [Terrimicrobiaceae bacterium]